MVELAPPCTVDRAYLDEHKACAVDTDCALLEYRPTCCENTALIAVTETSVESVRSCADPDKRVCQCTTLPTRAEDGRALPPDRTAAISARCVEHKCQSRVERRNCGTSKQCRSDDVCIAYRNVQGEPALSDADAGSADNPLISYLCVPNPCSGSLNCECAQVACDVPGHASRKCEIEHSTDSDVACAAHRE
jgi:hypothetical protein